MNNIKVIDKKVFVLSANTPEGTLFTIVGTRGVPYMKLKGAEFINMRSLRVETIPPDGHDDPIGIKFLVESEMREKWGLSSMQVDSWINHVRKIAGSRKEVIHES